MDNVIALCVVIACFGLVCLFIGIWAFFYNLKYDNLKDEVNSLKKEKLALISKNDYLENRVCELNKLIAHFDTSVVVSKTIRKSSKK